MESHPSSNELVLQLSEGQRKALFAKLAAAGDLVNKTTGGRAASSFHSIGKSIGNLRSMPTAEHRINQARMHAAAEKVPA